MDLLLVVLMKSIENEAESDEKRTDFRVLVFLRGVLLSQRMRFSGYEIVPTDITIDSDDQLSAVNTVLRMMHQDEEPVTFSEEDRKMMRSSHPVSIVDVKSVLATSKEEARDRCIRFAESVLLTLTLLRDVGGVIFHVVVIDKSARAKTNWGFPEPYRGILNTGPLAGESSASFQKYIGAVSSDPLNEFLVGLYKQAVMERHDDFKFVRYWQILEVTADLRNYDPKEALKDHDGEILNDSKGKPRKCKGGLEIVYALLRDEGVGNTGQTWANANIWYALRCAVGHYGAVDRWHQLSNPETREWGRKGAENRGDSLMLLRSIVRSVLTQKLSRVV